MDPNILAIKSHPNISFDIDVANTSNGLASCESKRVEGASLIQ